MKRSTLFASVIVASFLVIAGQDANAQSSWSTSKDVNRVANKSLFNDAELASTHLTASSSTQPSVVSQKGVSKVSLNATEDGVATGNVVSSGTPAWVNTKGVNQVSARPAKVKKAKQAEQQAQPLIPIDKKETNKD
jgi:hypothetical protein